MSEPTEPVNPVRPVSGGDRSHEDLLQPLEVVADITQEGGEEHDPQFEPVIRLTEQVESKTHEEDEEPTFKMCAMHASLKV